MDPEGVVEMFGEQVVGPVNEQLSEARSGWNEDSDKGDPAVRVISTNIASPGRAPKPGERTKQLRKVFTSSEA